MAPGAPRAAVLASGEGTNFEALARAARAGRLGAEIECLIVDRAAPAVLRAARLGIPVRRASLATLAEAVAGCDLLFLAGWRRILPPDFVAPRRGRILNVHPSLLPAYRGLDAVARAVAAGEKTTGVTIHLVVEDVDAGEILAQEAVPVAPAETLSNRIREVEHRLYPDTVAAYLARARA